MSLVAKCLQYDREAVAESILSVIKTVLTADVPTVDADDVREQITAAQDRKARLIELYMSGDISKDEFCAARLKCADEIETLEVLLADAEKRQETTGLPEERLQDICDTVHEILGGLEEDDEFYSRVLDRMVIVDRERIDVYLHLLPQKLSFELASHIGNAPFHGNEHYCGVCTYIGKGNVPFRILEDKHYTVGVKSFSFSTFEKIKKYKPENTYYVTPFLIEDGRRERVDNIFFTASIEYSMERRVG